MARGLILRWPNTVSSFYKNLNRTEADPLRTPIDSVSFTVSGSLHPGNLQDGDAPKIAEIAMGATLSDPFYQAMQSVRVGKAETSLARDALRDAVSQAAMIDALPTEQYAMEGETLGATLGGPMEPLSPDQAEKLVDALKKSGKPLNKVTDSKGKSYYIIKLPKEMGGFNIRVPVEG